MNHCSETGFVEWIACNELNRCCENEHGGIQGKSRGKECASESHEHDWKSEDEREDIRELVAEGKVKGIRTEDCKPGLYREPFTDPKDVAVIVAGTGAGGVIVFQTPCGSTAKVEDVEVTRPYMHKVIHGATLTKYGR